MGFLNRTALKVVNSEKLERVLEENRHEFVHEEELRDRGYKNHVWNTYKHNKVKESLKEKGKLKHMCKMSEHPVADRPPTEEWVVVCGIVFKVHVSYLRYMQYSSNSTLDKKFEEFDMMRP